MNAVEKSAYCGPKKKDALSLSPFTPRPHSSGTTADNKVHMAIGEHKILKRAATVVGDSRSDMPKAARQAGDIYGTRQATQLKWRPERRGTARRE